MGDTELVSIDWLPGVDGYFAGSDGQIYSRRNNRWGVGTKTRMLRPGRCRNGYMTVALLGTSYYVHSLVCRAFSGHPTEWQEVCHADGTRDNNVPTNLRWGTRSENMIDAAGHGRTNAGARHPLTPLNTEAVKVIRWFSGKKPRRLIAGLYGIAVSSVGAIQRGQTWRNT